MSRKELAYIEDSVHIPIRQLEDQHTNNKQKAKTGRKATVWANKRNLKTRLRHG